MLPKCSPRDQPLTADRSNRHLTQQVPKTQGNQWGGRFPGSNRHMRLRRRLATWDFPFDLCGDYLDGLSTEDALRTGEEAAERTAAKLAK